MGWRSCRAAEALMGAGVEHPGSAGRAEHQRLDHRLTGNNYGLVMVVGPVFMLLALVMMIGVRRGEAKMHVI